MSIEVNPKEFAGKRVLVSGGTKGLGRAAVERFLAGGARVITAARTIKDPIKGVEYVEADLTTAKGSEALAMAALERLGGIDVLAHVIGGSASPAGGFAALTDDHWFAELNLNLLATVRLDRLLIPQMLERGKGNVVHITSIQSVLPLPESTTGYAAAKAALRTYSKSISKELGPKGVRVNSVSPGWIMTEATGDFLAMLRAASGGTIEDARQSVLDALGGISIGRGAEPEEVADLIAYLASDRAAAIHGAEFVIDGDMGVESCHFNRPSHRDRLRGMASGVCNHSGGVTAAGFQRHSPGFVQGPRIGRHHAPLVCVTLALRRFAANSASATPPRIPADEISMRPVSGSPMNSAPPAAAMAGTVNWTNAALVRVMLGSTVYQMA